jgi:hypothetical protein
MMLLGIILSGIAFAGCSNPKPACPRFVRGTSTNPFIWMDEATGQSCWSGTVAGDDLKLPLCSTGEVPDGQVPPQ